MMPEKWVSVIGNIKDNFKVKDEGKFHSDEEGVILDKKTIYSNRIGSETKIDYVYSPDEKSHILVVYKWDESQNDWLEMDDNNLFN